MQHLFISNREPSTVVWRTAFPESVVVSFAQILAKNPRADVFWLHLGQGIHLKELVMLPRPKGSQLIVLSDQPDDEEGLAALNLGAVGYCNASAGQEVLLQIADVVSRNGLWVGPTLLNRLLRQTAQLQVRTEPRDNWADSLTPRETEIARAAARGLSNREIAEGLGITERTVKAHLTVIFEKLQLRDRLQLSLHVNGQA